MLLLVNETACSNTLKTYRRYSPFLAFLSLPPDIDGDLVVVPLMIDAYAVLDLDL